MNFRIGLLLLLIVIVLAGGIALYRHWPQPEQTTTTVPPPVKPPDTRPSAPEPPGQVTQPPDETLEPPVFVDIPLPPRTFADRVLVEKKARRLTLFYNNKLLKSYDIALGQQPIGPKQFEGDNKTPEGRYIIDSRKKNSSYHRALHISYPNPKDTAYAASQQRSAGGAIMIHGLPNGMGSMGRLHLLRDWTAGCIAVTNPEIEELWRVIPDGTPIEIRP